MARIVGAVPWMLLIFYQTTGAGTTCKMQEKESHFHTIFRAALEQGWKI